MSALERFTKAFSIMIRGNGIPELAAAS